MIYSAYVSTHVGLSSGWYVEHKGSQVIKLMIYSAYVSMRMGLPSGWDLEH